MCNDRQPEPLFLQPCKHHSSSGLRPVLSDHMWIRVCIPATHLDDMMRVSVTHSLAENKNRAGQRGSVTVGQCDSEAEGQCDRGAVGQRDSASN